MHNKVPGDRFLAGLRAWGVGLGLLVAVGLERFRFKCFHIRRRGSSFCIPLG